MNPTAGSFLVNPRLQRWFATFAIGLPGPTSLLTIYQVRIRPTCSLVVRESSTRCEQVHLVRNLIAVCECCVTSFRVEREN